MKLQSMTDFVLNESKTKDKETAIVKIYNYALFLKQTLKLEMFVPCDDEGNVLEYPPTQEEWEWATKDSMEAEQSFRQKKYYYKKAKEKVLFEGWEKRIKDYKLFKEHLDSFNSIEDVIGWDLTLTTNETKQFL